MIQISILVPILRLASYEIVNAVGQSVLSGNLEHTGYRIDLTALPNGTYMIIVEDQKYNFTVERVILMR